MKGLTREHYAAAIAATRRDKDELMAIMMDATIVAANAAYDKLVAARKEVRYVPVSSKNGTVYAIVSAADYDELMKYRWHLNTKGYAVSPKAPVRLMHRFIMVDHLHTDPKKRWVDHINGNRIDNRRTNLRMATHHENAANRKKRAGGTSIYHGVSFDRKQSKWHAFVTINGTVHPIGIYDTELEAAHAYDAFLFQRPDRDALWNLRNFPGKDYSEYVPRPKRKRIRTFDPTLIHTQMVDIDESTVQLTISGSKGVFIDREDYDRVKHMYCNMSGGYVTCRKPGEKATVALHRFLMNETDPSFVIDHIDNNRENNRKANLRRTTPRLNAQNKTKAKSATRTFVSNHVGIGKSRNQFVAYVKVDGKHVFKEYGTEEDVARRRDLFLLKHQGEYFHPLTYQWTPEEIETWTNKFEKYDQEHPKRTKKTKYVGVYVSGKRFRARIKKGSDALFDETFKTDKGAALARDQFLLDNPHVLENAWVKRDPLIIEMKQNGLLYTVLLCDNDASPIQQHLHGNGQVVVFGSNLARQLVFVGSHFIRGAL